MTSRSVFAGLAASLSNELQTWKSLTWRAYAIVSDVGIPRLPLDSAIDDQIKEGKVKMTINGNTFNFYDVVPERVFIEYEGPRFSLESLRIGVTTFSVQEYSARRKPLAKEALRLYIKVPSTVRQSPSRSFKNSEQELKR